ncbi:MAG: SPJ_0845 family protein [Enterococcus sp.]
MGLKFQKEDSLDKMLESFAILPEKKEKPENKQATDIERFLNPKPKEQKNEQNS